MGGRGSTSAGTGRASLDSTFREAHASRTRRSAENLAGAANAAIANANEVRRMVREGANPQAVNTSTIERMLLSDVRAAAVGTRLTVTAQGNFRDTAVKGSEGWEITDTSGTEGGGRFTDRQFAQYLLGANHVYYSD